VSRFRALRCPGIESLFVAHRTQIRDALNLISPHLLHYDKCCASREQRNFAGMHPTCGVNLFTGASTEANLCREGPFLCRGAANARAVNFQIASLRVSEGRTMLASVIQSGSRLEVKSRTEFVENVAGFILAEILRISNFTSKVRKKVHPRKFQLSIRPSFQHDKERFSAKAGEKQDVALLLCCFVALSIVHTCMPSSLLSN